MRKGRGKGKISNDLVAASCAAVLAVYAAGFLRTREAARRFETHARERRAIARAPLADVSPRPAEIKAPVLQSAPEPTAIAPPTSAIVAAPKPARPVVARNRPPRKAAVAMPAATAAAQPIVAQSSAPGTAHEIAPVPLPAEETTAPAPIPIRREPTPVSAAKWRDGTYTGLGDSPHGDIEARVVIKDGRIVEAAIATCDTRYPCNVIDPLIRQPVERQSPDVDYMSHATESSDAYYDAVVAALENAVEGVPDTTTAPQ